MTKAEREAFYDQVIAPELGRLGQLCEARGISFLALAEWAPGSTALSLTAQADRGAAMHLAMSAARCRGNADALIGEIARLSPAEGQTVQ
jgi:hypothetical protein